MYFVIISRISVSLRCIDFGFIVSSIDVSMRLNCAFDVSERFETAHRLRSLPDAIGGQGSAQGSGNREGQAAACQTWHQRSCRQRQVFTGTETEGQKKLKKNIVRFIIIYSMFTAFPLFMLFLRTGVTFTIPFFPFDSISLFILRRKAVSFTIFQHG